MKKALLVVAMLLLTLPVIRKATGIMPSKGLAGYTEPAVRPVLSSTVWFSGLFGVQLETFANQTPGFRNLLIRLHNQLDYSLFGLANARQVVAGKAGCLYEEQYIRAYLGADFAGREVIGSIVNGLKQLQDKLRDRNILFLVIFTPDKGHFYPEFIPDRYLRKGRSETNYQCYKELMESMEVNFIDFNQWFLQMKDTSRYVLYPKTGIHWSHYGAFLAGDSLRRYLEAKLAVTLPALAIDTIKVNPEPQGDDRDIMATMNLFLDTPTDPLAYPRYHLLKPEGHDELNALFIGDSFFWPLYNTGYPTAVFKGTEFWFYAQDIYRGRKKQAQSVETIDLYQAISKQNVIILLQTNAGYGYVGYDFVHKALWLPEMIR
jgi:hypothetical protein